MSMGQGTNPSPQQAFIFLYLALRILTGSHWSHGKFGSLSDCTKIFRTDLTRLLVLPVFFYQPQGCCQDHHLV